LRALRVEHRPHVQFRAHAQNGRKGAIGEKRMNTSHPGKGDEADRGRQGGGDPGEKIPKRPADTTASGEATNDTGEDNQQQKGERPAEDYVRR